MQDTKFIVFKREDWEKYTTLLVNFDVASECPDPVEDAVVIRRQDVFAPPALDAYANTISIAAELLRPLGLDEKADAMQEISDYFHEQAVASWDTDRKLPD